MGAVRSTTIKQREEYDMSNNYKNKDELKKLLPVYLKLLEAKGLTEKRSEDRWNCPFCGSGTGVNQTPAFHLSQDGTKFKCFSCNESGDIFDLVKHMEHMTEANYPRVYAKAEKIMKPYWGKQLHYGDEMEAQDKSMIHKPQDFSQYLEECHTQVGQTDYFHNRGLSDSIIDKFQLGFDPKQNIVTIPYNAGHEGTGYIHRTLWQCDHKYIKHGNELFNTNAILNKDSESVFITEGQIDAMSFEEIGYSALGLSGVNELEKLVELLISSGTQKYLLLALDNDTAGRRATGKIIESLAGTKLPFHFMAVSWMYGEHKDANEFLVHDRNGFRKQIEKMVSVI